MDRETEAYSNTGEHSQQRFERSLLHSIVKQLKSYPVAEGFSKLFFPFGKAELQIKNNRH
jgi:hypothetical protein